MISTCSPFQKIWRRFNWLQGIKYRYCFESTNFIFQNVYCNKDIFLFLSLPSWKFKRYHYRLRVLKLPPPPSNWFWVFQDGSFLCHFAPLYDNRNFRNWNFCNFRIYNFALKYVINFCLDLQLFKFDLICIFSIEILEKNYFRHSFLHRRQKIFQDG